MCVQLMSLCLWPRIIFSISISLSVLENASLCVSSLLFFHLTCLPPQVSNKTKHNLRSSLSLNPDTDTVTVSGVVYCKRNSSCPTLSPFETKDFQEVILLTKRLQKTRKKRKERSHHTLKKSPAGGPLTSTLIFVLFCPKKRDILYLFLFCKMKLQVKQAT